MHFLFLYSLEYYISCDISLLMQSVVKCPVIEAGKFTKELRIEYRPIKLLLAHYKEPKEGRAERCSNAMTVGELFCV